MDSWTRLARLRASLIKPFSFDGIMPEYTPKEKMKGLLIPSQINSDLAYLCGIFAGDGSLSFRKNKNEYALTCVGNPLDEKELYFQIIGPTFLKVFGYTPKMRLYDGGTTFGFRTYSKNLVLYLTRDIGLPLGRKYGSIQIPLCFLSDKNFLFPFLRGLFDTDGCIVCRKQKNGRLYPVLVIPSRNSSFIKQISQILKELGFYFYEVYDYKVKDLRIEKGFTLISRIEISGHENLERWFRLIGFSSPKHLLKYHRVRMNSEGWKSKPISRDRYFEPSTSTQEIITYSFSGV